VWAVKGAEQRLMELAEEAGKIFAAFPELRVRGRLFETAGQTAPASHHAGEGTPKKRHKRSAAARKRMSEAQKARWAKRREEQSAGKSATTDGARKKR
jgi:hypothetical protein